MTGSFPYVKYRPNDVSAWKAEMYDIFMSLDLEYAVDTDTDQLDHKIFCEDYLNKDPNTIKQSRSKRLFTKMQARCNTMLRLATSASQHRLMLGLGQNTFKIWNHLCKAPTDSNKRSRVSELIATLYTTKVSTCGGYKAFRSTFDSIILKLEHLKAKPNDDDLKDHFLRALDTTEFIERIEVAFEKTDYAKCRQYIDNSVDLRSRYQRIRSNTSRVSTLNLSSDDICRGFAKTGKCTFKSCRWKHPGRRDQNSNNNSSKSNSNKNTNTNSKRDPPAGAKPRRLLCFHSERCLQEEKLFLQPWLDIQLQPRQRCLCQVHLLQEQSLR